MKTNRSPYQTSWQDSVGSVIMLGLIVWLGSLLVFKQAVRNCARYTHPSQVEMNTLLLASSSDMMQACRRAAYGPFSNNEERVAPLRLVAELYWAHGEYAFASYVLSDLIDIEPSRAVHYVSRGAARAALGKHQDAIRDYDVALEIGLPRTHDAGTVHALRGRAHYESGRLEMAIAEYTAAVSLFDPKSPEAQLTKAALELLNRERGR